MCGESVRCPVRGAVVDDDDLVIHADLAQCSAQGAAQTSLAVVGWDDDGDVGARHAARAFCRRRRFTSEG
jgi:hypothetical protein